MKKKIFVITAISLVIITAVIMVFAFKQRAVIPNTDISQLGMPFLEEDRENYVVDIDAHAWSFNDATHFYPVEYNNSDKFITFFAPIDCLVERVQFTKMVNEGVGEEKHCVKIGLIINASYIIDLSIETFSVNDSDGDLQRELTYIEVGQSIKKGDRVITLVSPYSGGHICYTIICNNVRHNPIDFMTPQDLEIFSNN